MPPLLGPQEQLGLDIALRANMLDRADLGYRKDNAETEFRLEKVRRLLHDPLALAPHADEVARELRGVESLATLTVFLAREREIGIPPIQNPKSKIQNPADPIAHIFTACERASALLTKAFASVPADERLRASALYAAEELHQPADVLKKIGADKFDFDTAHLAMLAPHRKMDYAALAEAFRVICAAIDEALPGLKAQPPVLMTRDTPLGKIIVGTPGKDVYRDEALLIIDPGGDDVYLNAAGGADGLAGRPISIVIDLAGNDRYEGRSFSQGNGFWGIGVLLDCAGDDIYAAQNCSQGAGLFGCGLLADFGGRDRYEADTMAQGAATFGLAALWDRAGNDGYRAAQFAQAVAGVGGCGALLESEGGDTYHVGGKYGDAERYSAHFLSLGQGFAIGDRPFAAGGVAILCDLAGNDSYYADIYGQGVSYWYSLGLLLDLAGNDTYRIHHYGQGAGIHLSAALLADWLGDDSFTAHGLCQGSAHDYGVGLLFDKAGHDHYMADEIAQGSAVNNATGILVDSAGDDVYAGRDANQCQAAGHDGVKREYGAVALFCDLAGRDAYVGGGRDNFIWLKPFHGAGLDTEITNAVWQTSQHATRNTQHEMPEALEPHYGPTSWRAPRTEAEKERASFYEKTVSYGDSGEKLVVKQKAIDDIRKRGVAVLPFLTRQLDRREPMARQRIEDWVSDWGKESIPALLDGLAIDNFDIRRNCIFFLRQWPDPRVAPAVMKFLSVERLQPVCLHTLGKQKAAGAFDDALRLLQSSPKELVRMRAAQALGRIGSPKAVPALIAALEDSLWDVRRQAEDALVALGKPSVEPLLDALPKLSLRALPHAIETLGRLGVPALERWLASNDWAVRGFAVATLTDAAKLRALRETERHPFVRSRIDGALEKLQAAQR